MNVAKVKEAALGLQKRREDDIRISEIHGEEKLPEERMHRHAPGAFICREDILFARRVVELLLPGLDDHIAASQFSVIDLRPVDLESPMGGTGRDILHEQDRESFAGYAIHGSKGQSVTVSELQMFVDPLAVRQAGRVQFPRR